MSEINPTDAFAQLGYLDPDNDQDLEGLSARQKVAIRKNQSKAVNTVLRMQVAPKSVKQFISRQNLLPDAVKNQIAQGEMAIDYYDMYRATQITPGNTIHLIDTNVNKLPGVTNFKDRLLPKGAHMLISSIMLEYGYDAGGAINNAALIEYSPFGNIPIAIQNAVMHLRVGKHFIVEDLPLRNFFSWENGAAPTAINRADLAFEIQKDSILWNEEQELDITIEFAAGADVAPYTPAGDHYLRIHLIGAGVGIKVK